MKEAETTVSQDAAQDAAQDAVDNPELSTFTSVAGAILGISYPVLAISSLARASYQLVLKEGVTNYLAPTLTLVAAILYLIATIGFAYRRPWSWKLSVGALGLETLLAFTIGVLSLIMPDVIGRTVWSNFGMDYAFFPFIQPILGLIWLTRPTVIVAYGLRSADPSSKTPPEARI